MDITRGRQANHLYLTRAPDPLDGEHLPKAPDPDLPVAVSDRLRRSGPERVAIEFRFAANPVPPGTLPLPPDAWTSRIVVPPPGPIHLRRRHDQALRHVLDYRSQCGQFPTAGGPWAWALGTETGGPELRQQRAGVITTLDELALTLANEHLRPHGINDDWATEQLVHAVAAGAPAEALPHLARVLAQLSATEAGSSSDVPDLTHVSDVLRGTPFREWLVAAHQPPRRQPPVLTR